MAEAALGRPGSILSPDALDFAPDLLAIQERPPERLPRVILGSVVGLIGVMLTWATFAKLDIIASSEGRLVPASFTKVVQPSEPGVVSEIMVSRTNPGPGWTTIFPCMACKPAAIPND